MTVTMLLNNLVESWELKLQNRYVGQELFSNKSVLLDLDKIDSEEFKHEFSYNLNLHKQLQAEQNEADQDGEEEASVAKPQSVFRPFNVLQGKK